MEIVFEILTKWGALVLAGASFVIALISLIKSSKAQKVQSRLNEIEIRIKKYELQKIEEEKIQKACVEARLISISHNKTKMKIWNAGNSIARNIDVEIEEGAPIVFAGELLPFEELEPGKNFDIPVITYMGQKSKFYVTTKWSDSEGNQESKKQLVSF